MSAILRGVSITGRIGAKTENQLPPIVGETITFTEPGTYYWIIPDGVTSVCALCVGAGAGGANVWANGGNAGVGGGGAVRVIWGAGKSYPSNAV